MSKIKIEQKRIISRKLEFEIERGELVLVENINPNHPMVFGIYKGLFKSLSSSKPSLEFSWCARVWPSISIGGVYLPHVLLN